MPDGDGSAGPALVSMAQAFTGLPMEALIGGPLLAAAKANHQMACDQVNYIMSTCFQTSSASGSGGGTGGDTAAKTYTPVMITMSVERPVLTPGANGTQIQKAQSTIAVPLLAIMPLNALAVDSVDIKFQMEVKSSYSQSQDDKTDTKDSDSGSFTGEGWIGPFKCTISGSVSHDSDHSTDQSSQYQKSNDAQYTVEVHAGQIATPPGIGILIQAFASAISPIEMPALSGSGGANSH